MPEPTPLPEVDDDIDESAERPDAPIVLRVRTFGLDPKFHTNYAGSRAILGKRGNVLKRRSNLQLVKAGIGSSFGVILASAEGAIDDVRAALLQNQLIIVELAKRLGLEPTIDFRTDDPLKGFVQTTDDPTIPRAK